MKIIPSLVLTSPRPTARHHRSSSGYSLMEVIVVVATLTSVTAMAVISINNTQVGGKSSKLRQDVAVLNSAVRAYLLSGGDLSNTTTGGAVIAKLKTTTDTSNSNQIAGLRGSMVDQRLSGISSSEAGVLKAVWVDSQ